MVKKSTIKIIISGLIIALILFCVFLKTFSFDKNISKKSTSIIQMDDLEIFYSKEIVNVYFGRKDCQLCNKLDNLIEKNETNLPEVLYYFDTVYWSENEMADIICKKFSVTKVPTVISIQNGKKIKEFEIQKLLL